MSINIMVLSAINILVIVPLLVMLVLVFIRLQGYKRAQDAMVQNLDPASGDWYRINIARPQFFARRLKLNGVEGKGVLIKTPDHVRIIAALGNDEHIDLRVTRDRLKLRWLGNAGIASANLHWISLSGNGRELMLSADTGFNALQSREATADLCRRIDPAFALPVDARHDFALDKNPASLLVVSGFLLLLAYGLLDGILLNPYVYLGLGISVYGFALLVLFSLPCYAFLSTSKVPARESLVLSQLLVIGLAVAYVPAIKRLDLSLAGDRWQSVAFVKKSDTEYEAKSPGPPAIFVPAKKAYWRQFHTGDSYSFDVIRGPLGVWQMDPRKAEEAARRYDQTHPVVVQ